MLKNTNSKKIIEFKNVSKIYGNKDKGNLLDISFSIKEGEFVSFVGISGCGKSTIMQLLTDIKEKTSGEIIKPEKTVMVFQKTSLLPWLTVKENIELVLTNEKINNTEKNKIVKKSLKLLQIDKLANKYPSEISGGQIQRVAIARALSFNPNVLILDEPFSALDEKTKEELHEDILKIWEKHKLTIIMISHQLEEVVLMSQRIFLMKERNITKEYKIGFKYPRKIESKITKKILEIRKAL